MKPFKFLNTIRHFKNLTKIKQRHVLFVWIPKTGGTTVYRTLKPFRMSKIKVPDKISLNFKNRGWVTFGHIQYSELVQKGLVNKNFNNESFKFSFVRNPFDRTVSLFFYLKKRKMINSNLSFDEFCLMLNKRDYPKTGFYHVNGLSQANPQAAWLRNINMDFIGKLENFNQDFKTICDIIGVPAPANFSKENSSSHGNFKNYYSKKAELIIQNLYGEDFKYFEYPDTL